MVLLANFKSWKISYIFIALVIMSVIFVFVPPFQKTKNKALYYAVAKNDLQKVKFELDHGANKNLILDTGLPLISIAIELENIEMVKLLLDETIDLNRSYAKGYWIVEHAKEKNNPELLDVFVESNKKK